MKKTLFQEIPQDALQSQVFRYPLALNGPSMARPPIILISIRSIG